MTSLVSSYPMMDDSSITVVHFGPADAHLSARSIGQKGKPVNPNDVQSWSHMSYSDCKRVSKRTKRLSGRFPPTQPPATRTFQVYTPPGTPSRIKRRSGPNFSAQSPYGLRMLSIKDSEEDITSTVITPGDTLASAEDTNCSEQNGILIHTINESPSHLSHHSVPRLDLEPLYHFSQTHVKIDF